MIWFLTIWSMISLSFMSLACSMSKHQKQIFAQQLSPRRTQLAHVLGWVLLVLSVLMALYTRSISIALSYWLGVATFAALFVAAILSYFSSNFKRIAIVLSGLALITALSSVIYPLLRS